MTGDDNEDVIHEESGINSAASFFVPLFGDYAEEWLNIYKSCRAEWTKTMYRQQLYFLDSIWNLRLDEIRKSQCQAIISSNAEHPRKCQKIHLTMSQIFDAAIEDGYINRNPAKKLNLPKYVQDEKRVMTQDELQALSKASFTEMEKSAVYLLFYFGLRPEEMRAVTVNDIDLEKHVLKVNKAIIFSASLPVVKNTKNNRKRTIPIADKIYDFFRKRIENLKEGFLVSEQYGEPLNRGSYEKMYSSIMGKIKDHLILPEEPGLNFYSFRHTFATHLYDSGVKPGKISVKFAAYLCGNTVDVFMKWYAHIELDRELTESSEVINMLTEI